MVGPANERWKLGPISLHGPMGYLLHVWTATWLILPVIQDARNPKLTDSYLVGPASNSGANTCTKPRIYIPGLRRFEVIDRSGFKGFPDLDGRNGTRTVFFRISQGLF